jgi:hypothetical protein
MGIFGSIKSNWEKSKAAVIVQNLLEHQASVGFYDLNPAKHANELVGAVWDSKPDVFNGKLGQRPHKITVAASALAHGIDRIGFNDPSSSALGLSLGNILSELETNGRLYPLNSIDHQLLEEATATFMSLSEEVASSELVREMEPYVNGQEYTSWDEWYLAFKQEAGAQNPQLKTNKEGKSLVDFMEDEPLKRAFQDGKDPLELAREFADQFDVRTFG